MFLNQSRLWDAGLLRIQIEVVF